MTPARIVVVGRKNFGPIDIVQLLHTPRAVRGTLKYPPSAEQVKTNAIMAGSLAPSTFLNLQRLVCDPDSKCPVFADNSELISFDGGHLTLAGACFVGKKIIADPIVRNLFQALVQK
jgi:hypothetical protein